MKQKEEWLEILPMVFDNFERTLFKAKILLWYDKCKIKIQCSVEI